MASVSEQHLSRQAVCDFLRQHDESCRPDDVGYYGSIEALASTVHGSRHWALGQAFVYAESADRFLVLLQVAPNSNCMATFNRSGLLDTLSPRQYELQEFQDSLARLLDRTQHVLEG